MPISFPASPQLNSKYTYSGKTWTWNGYAWKADATETAVGPAGTQGAIGPQGVAGPQGGFNSSQTVSTISSALTLGSTDAGKLYVNSTAATVTVTGLAAGQQVDFLQTNAGQLTFTAGAGVTLNSKDGKLKTAAIYSAASIKCIAANSYVLIGDLG